MPIVVNREGGVNGKNSKDSRSLLIPIGGSQILIRFGRQNKNQTFECYVQYFFKSLYLKYCLIERLVTTDISILN